MIRPIASLLLLLTLACPKGPVGNANTTQTTPWTPPTLSAVQEAPLPSADKVASIFFTADVQGHVEPCGCSKDPLGGVDRLAGYINSARKRPNYQGDLFFDVGDLLFESTDKNKVSTGTKENAALIATLWNDLGCDGAATGPRDLVDEESLSKLPRLRADDPNKRRGLHQLAGVSIGVFAIAAPESGAPSAKDYLGEARSDIAALQKEGASLIIALAYQGNNKNTAGPFLDDLSRMTGLSAIVVASGDPDNLAKSPSDFSLPEEKNGVLILRPYAQGQSVTEIELHIMGDDKTFEDGGRSTRHKQAAASLADRMQPLISRIKEAEAKQQDYASLAKAVQRLESQYEEESKAAQTTVQGSFLVAKVVLLDKNITGDEAVAKRKEDAILAQQATFKKLAQTQILPSPDAGKASYIGAAKCQSCHTAEYEFWKTTKHSHALETLKTAKRDGLPECVTCHVAGLNAPGGTTLTSRIEELAGVQCENCHGAGSLHAASMNKVNGPDFKPVPGEAQCRSCHYPPHTNDFNFQERFPKIVGKGHGYNK